VVAQAHVGFGQHAWQGGHAPMSWCTPNMDSDYRACGYAPW